MNHLQFEPPPEFYVRLFATLQNPGKFNQSRKCDRQLLQAGILIDQRKQEDQRVWDRLSKICHFGTRDIPYNCPPKSSKEWAKQYADHCRGTIARIVTPSVNIEREVAIALRHISLHLGTCSEIPSRYILNLPQFSKYNTIFFQQSQNNWNKPFDIGRNRL